MVGVDDENRSCILGQGLLRSECAETFEWFLKKYEEGAGGRRWRPRVSESSLVTTTCFSVDCLWHVPFCQIRSMDPHGVSRIRQECNPHRKRPAREGGAALSPKFHSPLSHSVSVTGKVAQPFPPRELSPQPFFVFYNENSRTAR